jgi:gamma-glutamyltranspeptidase / glutathione hydrolase
VSNLSSNEFTTRPVIEGNFGVVTSTHWLGTAVGMGVLERGGNAFDAAVATAFTLQVAEPHLNGPAGDVTIIFHSAATGRQQVLCGQGPAPASATIDRFNALGLDLVPGTGLLAACTPGIFDSWMLLLRDHGTMRLRDVLAPAIGYAGQGVPVLERIEATIATVEDIFRQHWTSSAAVFLPGGRRPRQGELLCNSGLAATYRRILDEADSVGDREAEIERARRVWSQGFVAEAIDRFCRTQDVVDVTGRAHRGLLTGEDMAQFEAHYEAPLGFDYGRYRALKAGPWSQGPVMLQQLALLKGFGLDGLDPCGPDFIHLQVECAKLAFADREAFYGDPNFVAVPIEALLSDEYNDERRRLVTAEASHELRPGCIDGRRGRIVAGKQGAGAAAAVAAGGAGEPTVGRLGEVVGDTVHFDVVDRHGNMVSATPSGGWLQSSPVIPELGFPLGTRAQMFWLEEGLPNSLVPGKRPRTTLTPSLALRDGEPYLAWGSPGGDQQDQWTTQLLLRHVHAGMNLQETIDAPAWHSEHFPSSFWPRTARPGVLVAEGRLPRMTVDELRRRGHIVEVGDDWSEGRLTAASRAEGRLRAAANARGMQAYAAGR